MKILRLLSSLLIRTNNLFAFNLSMSHSTTTSTHNNLNKKIIEIGLTGSIGMGKSSIANIFKTLGFPVFDSDAVVHSLYAENGEAVPYIKELLPDVIINNTVDRKLLGQHILNNNTLLKQIENIVHPLVKQKRIQYRNNTINNNYLFIIYDIPLLYETNQQDDFDYIIVVTASLSTQKARVLARPGIYI